MASSDFNRQLFASGRQQGALGSMGAGDAKAHTIPLLAAVLPGGFGKDSKHGVFAGLDTKGFFSGEVNGIGGIFQPKSGDQWVKNLGSGRSNGESLKKAPSPRASGPFFYYGAISRALYSGKRRMASAREGEDEARGSTHSTTSAAALFLLLPAPALPATI